MDILIVVVIMVVVGLIIGWLAKNVIWKDDRKNDILIAVMVSVITGLLDWFVIDALGMAAIWRYVGVATEPPFVALGVLWLVRYANRNR